MYLPKRLDFCTANDDSFSFFEEREGPSSVQGTCTEPILLHELCRRYNAHTALVEALEEVAVSDATLADHKRIVALAEAALKSAKGEETP